ncbi:hypothetical protein LY78DRAFT_672462 [Colletotrichum sublineola]|nr:hypothetical protein LY78DRAFT_672462 [Colletotrichum sublineola]
MVSIPRHGSSYIRNIKPITKYTVTNKGMDLVIREASKVTYAIEYLKKICIYKAGYYIMCNTILAVSTTHTTGCELEDENKSINPIKFKCFYKDKSNTLIEHHLAFECTYISIMGFIEEAYVLDKVTGESMRGTIFSVVDDVVDVEMDETVTFRLASKHVTCKYKGSRLILRVNKKKIVTMATDTARI